MDDALRARLDAITVLLGVIASAALVGVTFAFGAPALVVTAAAFVVLGTVAAKLTGVDGDGAVSPTDDPTGDSPN